MRGSSRPGAFWVIWLFLALSLVALLLGQSTALFAYDLAVRMGLQESVDEVSAFGFEFNRAFGLGDTAIYVPLIVVSLIGLLSRKRWALFTTAAAMGISAYWTVTVGAALVFFQNVPGYTFVPGPEYWVTMGAFFIFGLWGLIYLARRGDELIRQG